MLAKTLASLETESSNILSSNDPFFLLTSFLHGYSNLNPEDEAGFPQTVLIMGMLIDQSLTPFFYPDQNTKLFAGLKLVVS